MSNKLKCDKHDRRIMILPEAGKWVHRTGNMSDCDGTSASIGDSTIIRNK